MKYRLGDLCNIVSGSTPKTNIPEYWGGNLKWVTPAELSDDSYIINDTVRKITELGVSKTALNSFPAGTVLLSSRAPIGKVAIAGCDMYCNQGFKNLICSSKIYNKYLFWFLKSKTDFLNLLGRGATFKEISKQIVSDIEIELPDFEKQVKVANIFEKISHLISLRNQQLEQLDLLIKSRFVEMFGDPVINEKGWEVNFLNNHLKIIGGFAFNSKSFTDCDGIPVLRIGNINSGYFKPTNLVFYKDDDKLNKYKLYPGDSVISLTGTVGKDDYGNICILGNEYNVYYLNQRNAKLELFDTLNKFYLYNLLKFDGIKKGLTGLSRGIRQANISNKDIENLLIPIPPLALQNQFAAFVEEVEKEKATVKQSLEQLDILKKKLMQEYFG